MRNRHKYALILIILIISVVFGLLTIKKAKSFNKTNTTPVNNQDQPGVSSNQENANTAASTVTCPDCDGSGSVVCPECEGRGLYYHCGECQEKYPTYLNTCPSCGSRNTFIQNICSPTITCPRCGGSGQITA